ncbi:MAG: hypothetical protein HYY67_07425 [Thaumarchaeota archaeon]|nr:hypothetical protein [Nitrososphaerota archaeon]
MGWNKSLIAVLAGVLAVWLVVPFIMLGARLGFGYWGMGWMGLPFFGFGPIIFLLVIILLLGVIGESHADTHTK